MFFHRRLVTRPPLTNCERSIYAKKCYYWVDKMTKLFLVFETWVPKSECPLVALRDTLAHCFKKANNNHHVVVIIFMCKWRTVTLETHPAVITYGQIRAYIEWRWNMITSVPYPWSRKIRFGMNQKCNHEFLESALFYCNWRTHLEIFIDSLFKKLRILSMLKETNGIIVFRPALLCWNQNLSILVFY